MAVDERTFLQTVAKALGRREPLTHPPERSELGPPAFWREQKFEPNAPFDLFKKNLEALTGRVELAKNAEDVTRRIETWLQELNATAVIMWDDPELKKYVRLTSNGIKVDFWSADKSSDELIAAAERADVGITWADYAIGYSGTLSLINGPGKGRSVSLLPPTHIAVLRKSNIVATMSTVIREITGFIGTEKMPSFVDFITGPSRTSDIEMDLSIGVHGPYRVWTIVIDES